MKSNFPKKTSKKQALSEDEYLRLLMEDPHKFIESHQLLIERTAYYFLKRGFISAQEVGDLIQSVNEKLLTDRLRKMQRQYNSSVKLRVYFTRIIYHLCLEILRSKRKEKRILVDSEFVEQTEDASQGILTNLIIEEEINRLHLILRLSFEEKAKLEIVLKLINHLPLNERDVKRYCPNLEAKEVHSLLERVNKDCIKLNNKEIFKRCNLLFNYCEHKNSTGDAVRKWLEPRINELLRLLNNRENPQDAAQYSKETLNILVRKYFEKKEEKNSNFD